MRSLNIDKSLGENMVMKSWFYQTTVTLLNFKQVGTPRGSQPQMHLHGNKSSKSRCINIHKLKVLDKCSHLCLALFSAEELFKIQDHWMHQQQDKALGGHDSLQSVGKEKKRYQSTSATTGGHGQNPMAQIMALQEPFPPWTTQGFNATSPASSGCSEEQRANVWQMEKWYLWAEPWWRWAVLSTHSLHGELRKCEKTTSTGWSQPWGSGGSHDIGWPKTTRKWVGGMWQAIQGEKKLNLHFCFF